MEDFSTRYIPTSVVLTGTACKGTDGPLMGHVDIGVSESYYLFRVALPGVGKDKCDLHCEIERDGKVHLQGVVTDWELSKKIPETVFHLDFAQLCPPGPFTLYFKLPGAVDPRLFSAKFRLDGILEGVVMKCRAPSEVVSHAVNN